MAVDLSTQPPALATAVCVCRHQLPSRADGPLTCRCGTSAMYIEEPVSSHGLVARRRDLQTAPARKRHNTPTVVTTASQLSAEITKGTPHILIQQHLDLSALSDLEIGGVSRNGSEAQGFLPTTVKSIRVRPTPLPAPALPIIAPSRRAAC